MIVTVPPHVDRLMQERASGYVCRSDRAPTADDIRFRDKIKRTLIEAWTEGVMHAWTIQDIKETSR